MEALYWVYVNVFWCFRQTQKLLYTDEPKQLEASKSKWMMVDATLKDGGYMDVTDQIRNIVRSDALLTPEFLEKTLRIENVAYWSYLTQTLEYNKIPPEGIVNGL
jgi:hypothetical protein